MEMLLATTPDQIDEVYLEYLSRLVKAIMNQIKSQQFKKIVEIGAGVGNFTIPFLIQLGDAFNEYTCIDPYPEPYIGHREILERKLRNDELAQVADKIKIIEKDATELDILVADADLVIGYGVLCVLSPEQILQVMSSSFNALTDDGLFLHTDLSPFPMSRAEELLQLINIEYISDSEHISGWFAPTADDLAGLAYKSGFKNINISYKKIPLKFQGDAAMEMLKAWKVKHELISQYLDEIKDVGLEFPMAQILSCCKD